MADTNIDNVNIEIQGSSEKAAQSVDSLIQTLNNLNSSLGNIQNNTNKYIQSMQQISEVSKEIKTPKVSNDIKSPNVSKELQFLNSNLPQTPKKIIDNKSISESTSKISGLKSALKDIGSVAGKTGNRISRMLQTVVKTKAARIGIKALGSAFGGMGDKLGSVKDRISSAFKSLSKYALALYGIRSAFYAVRNVTNEFLSSQDAMAQRLSANISYLKFSLGSMLAPVIDYLTNLMFKLLQIIQYIVYYFARINIFAGRSAKSYASMGKSAAKAAKETQKQLQAFDELNNINLENNNGSGGGAGDGGAVPDFDLSKVKEFSGPILEAIKLGDWYEVGLQVGQKINDIFESINWDEIQKKMNTIANGIGDFINGLVDGTDWTLLGSTLGDAANTIIQFGNSLYDRINFDNIGSSLAAGFNSLLYKIDWEGLGKFLTLKWNMLIDIFYGLLTNIDYVKLGDGLGDGLMSAIENIQWGKAAQSLSAGIKGLLDAAVAFIKKLDWKIIFDAIGEFLSNIDWGGIVSGIFEFLGAAAASLVNLGQVIGNYLAQAFDGIGQFFNKEIENAGGNIAKGILNGILKIFYNIGEWVVKNIFEPFVKGFKDVFKISSPSKVMMDLGVFIIQGLLDGISSLVGKITDIAKKIWDNFTTTLSGIANWVNTTIVQPVIGFFTNIYTSAIQIGKNIYTGFTNSISNISNFVSTRIIQPVVNAFTNLWNTISGIFNKIKTAITNAFSNLNIKIRMPHFSWGTQPANGWVANILKALNLPTSLPKLKIDWYAEGGYPTEGDLFFANEAGPEMVGTIGNKNAVANNDQIERAIANATYEAVSRALYENQDSNQPIIVNVGNETLYKGMTRSRSQASNQYGITV